MEMAIKHSPATLAEMFNIKIPTLSTYMRRKGLTQGRFSKDAILDDDVATVLIHHYGDSKTTHPNTTSSIVAKEDTTLQDTASTIVTKSDATLQDKTDDVVTKENTTPQDTTSNVVTGDNATLQDTTDDAVTIERSEPKTIVFENQYLFLVMLGLICLIDGIGMSIIATEVLAIGSNIVVKSGYFTAGAIIAYAGLQNAYTLSQKKRASWDEDYTIAWVAIFTIYQIMLHGSAAGFFESFNELIGKIVIAIGIPLATAALSVLLFHNQTNKT